MNKLHTICLLISVSLLTLVGCAPEKKEEVPPPPITQPAPPAAQLPPTQPEEVQPDELEGLTPLQQDELKIEEDEVMNPFPG